MHASSVLTCMTFPKSIAEPVVVIHNDPHDFEDFLWFIHAE